MFIIKDFPTGTAAEDLDGRFTTGATVNARPGGEIHFRWREWGPDRVSLEDGGPILPLNIHVLHLLEYL